MKDFQQIAMNSPSNYSFILRKPSGMLGKEIRVTYITEPYLQNNYKYGS